MNCNVHRYVRCLNSQMVSPDWIRNLHSVAYNNNKVKMAMSMLVRCQKVIEQLERRLLQVLGVHGSNGNAE